MDEENELCERRANELEALKAIFGEDIHDLRLVDFLFGMAIV